MEVLALKRRLFDSFGGFGDKRIKNLSKGDYFICDDRSPGDLDAKGALFGWFCTIGLRVVSGDVVQIEIGNAMPKNDAINKWWSENTVEGKYGQRVLQIEKENISKLDELAKLISAITQKPYKIKAYKYVCPQTSSSLLRTKKILEAAWTE